MYTLNFGAPFNYTPSLAANGWDVDELWVWPHTCNNGLIIAALILREYHLGDTFAKAKGEGIQYLASLKNTILTSGHL